MRFSARFTSTRYLGYTTFHYQTVLSVLDIYTRVSVEIRYGRGISQLLHVISPSDRKVKENVAGQRIASKHSCVFTHRSVSLIGKKKNNNSTFRVV